MGLKLPGFPGNVKAGGELLSGRNAVTIFLRQLDFFLTDVYVYVNCIIMPKGRYYIEGIFIPWNLLSPPMAGAREKNFWIASPKYDREKILRIIKRWQMKAKWPTGSSSRKLKVKTFLNLRTLQIRMPCYFHAAGRLIITHGFIKKGDRIRPEEIDRMKRIRDEYEKRT